MEMILSNDQKQILSTNTITFLNMLQMNNIELVEYLNNQVLENPLIDLETSTTTNKSDDILKKLEWLDSTDEQNKIYFKYDYENISYIENLGSIDYDLNSLAYSLIEQIYFLNLDEDLLKICKFIINNLNDDGFLEYDLKDLANHLKISKSLLSKGLKIVQNLEPLGVGARSLCECLLIQLKNRNIHSDLTEKLVKFELDRLYKAQIGYLAKKYNVSEVDIQKSFSIIKSLNPKPCNIFIRNEIVKYIIPDIIAVKFENYFEVFLNEYELPSLKINTTYLNSFKSTKNNEIRKYINEKYNNAKWLINSLHNRNETLLKIANTIIEMQCNFFENGFGYMQPLKQSDIALKLRLNNSTISRCLKNKYLQCKYGVFPLSYFFVTNVKSENENTSSEFVKTKLKEIIKNEDKINPLSDQMITSILNTENIFIKRRTISKYRDELNILSANQRKQQYKL